MKKLILGLVIWSVSALASATPIFIEGALSYISRNGSQVRIDGGDGEVFSNAHYSPFASTFKGDARASVFNNPSQPLRLIARSFSSSASSIDSQALAIKHLRYVGTSATTITATAAFQGTISGVVGRIIGRIALISASGDMNALISDFNDRTLFGDLSSGGTHGGLVSSRNQLTASTSSFGSSSLTVNTSRFVNLAVNPNDEFFLYGEFNAIAYSGSVATEAYNPLGARYTLTGVTSGDLVAVSAVPVPAAVWLMGSALIGLSGFRRKIA